MKIKKALLAYEPESFRTAFGFKGNALTGVWQTVVYLDNGYESAVGLGVQSVLWSDSKVFAEYGEEKSNKMMLDVTSFALKYIEGSEFINPKELISAVFPKAYEFAKKITNMNVTETFVLNALVPLDLAAWILYSKENKKTSFDDIYKGTYKSDRLANIPLITYNTPIDEVMKMANDGTCIFKIKIGSDPEKDGDLNKMLQWDKKRVAEIHKVLKDINTEYTRDRKIVYYFDANGRYDNRDRLEEFIEYIDREGILKQTVLFEEPFAQENEIYVGDLPVCFAADESAHSLNDVRKRIELGYKAMTLKPIAKTVSVSIDMADCAVENNIQCFCADLTVNPIMVEWNKNFAARLKPLQGMNIGVVESNGAQNYVNWQSMLSYMPVKRIGNSDSVYVLDEEFYKNSGGIFMTPVHYYELIKSQNNM